MSDPRDKILGPMVDNLMPQLFGKLWFLHKFMDSEEDHESHMTTLKAALATAYEMGRKDGSNAKPA